MGDSRAVLYSKKERKVKSKILSTDHNLLRNDEIKRVREMKGRVVGKKGAKKRVLPPSSVASSDVNAKKLSLGFYLFYYFLLYLFYFILF